VVAAVAKDQASGCCSLAADVAEATAEGAEGVLKPSMRPFSQHFLVCGCSELFVAPREVYRFAGQLTLDTFGGCDALSSIGVAHQVLVAPELVVLVHQLHPLAMNIGHCQDLVIEGQGRQNDREK
jgi:hypothetical protein